jgi:CBS domain-containing protein
MPIEDIARDEVVTVPASATVGDAGEQMRREDVGSAVVVDDDRPVGIVTDRDIALHLLEDGSREDDATAVMHRDPVTVEASDGVYTATATMAEHGVRRLPVVEDGRLCGMVTLDDVVVLLGMEIGHVSRTIRSGSPAYDTLATDIYGEE